MSLAVLASRARCGLDGLAVRVEVHVGTGLPIVADSKSITTSAV